MVGRYASVDEKCLVDLKEEVEGRNIGSLEHLIIKNYFEQNEYYNDGLHREYVMEILTRYVLDNEITLSSVKKESLYLELFEA